MKRTRLAALIAALLALILLFAGCTGTGTDNTKPDNGNSDATAKPAATEPGSKDEDATHPPAKENVAKIILIMGQSNAVGASMYSPLKDILDTETYEFWRKQGTDNIRIVYHAGETTATNYRSNLDNQTVLKLFDKVRFGKSLTGAQFGLEVGIAEYLRKAHPDDTYYLIKVARGGEPIDPKFIEGGELFERAISITEGCISVMKREGMTPEICAICWMQGENEALSMPMAKTYRTKLETLAESLRRRLAEYAPYGGIPFIDGGISTYWACHETVNQAKKEFAETSDINYFIDSMSLGLTYDKEPAGNPDLAHFDSESMYKLGQEFGKYVDMAYEKVK